MKECLHLYFFNVKSNKYFFFLVWGKEPEAGESNWTALAFKKTNQPAHARTPTIARSHTIETHMHTHTDTRTHYGHTCTHPNTCIHTQGMGHTVRERHSRPLYPIHSGKHEAKHTNTEWYEEPFLRVRSQQVTRSKTRLGGVESRIKTHHMVNTNNGEKDRR